MSYKPAKVTTSHKKLTTGQKQKRQMLLTVSMFLLKQEVLNGLVWTVRNVDFNQMEQTMKVGVETTSGNKGADIVLFRKLSKSLAMYLYEQGLTFRQAKIKFYINKEEESIQRIYNIIEKVI